MSELHRRIERIKRLRLLPVFGCCPVCKRHGVRTMRTVPAGADIGLVLCESCFWVTEGLSYVLNRINHVLRERGGPLLNEIDKPEA